MAKPVKRLRARRLDLLPLELLLLESAPPEIVVAGATVVPSKHIHGAIIKHYCVVGTRIGQLTLCSDSRPSFLIKVEVEKIIEVMPTLSLIAAKKVETIHEGNTTST